MIVSQLKRYKHGGGYIAASPSIMNILCQNYQELRNLQTILKFYHLVKVQRLSIIFIMETKRMQSVMKMVKCKVGFQNYFLINPTGCKGGLALPWREEVELYLVNYSNFHIHVQINVKKLQRKWFFTGFYGHQETSKHSESYNLLSRIYSNTAKPWCVAGYFNKILNSNEKWGIDHVRKIK